MATCLMVTVFEWSFLVVQLMVAVVVGIHSEVGDGYGRKFHPKGGHHLLVSGLLPTGSWQDVKDHFREAGDVVYADVYKDGTGVMEFSCHEHMKRAHIHTHMHIHTHTHTHTSENFSLTQL